MHDLEPGIGQPPGTHLPGGAGADHDDIAAALAHGAPVNPVRPALQGRGILPGCSAQPSRSPSSPPRSSRPAARTRTPRRPRTSTNATASTNDDTGSRQSRRGHRGRRARRAAGQGRRLPEPAVRHRAARRPAADLRGRAGGADRGRAWRQAAGQALPGHPLEGRQPAASRACSRMAFAPDYAQSGRFYVYYTEKSGTEAIWEYRRAGADSADPGSARLVLRMADPEPNHNGGLMVFGPDKLHVRRHRRRRRGQRPARRAGQRAVAELAAGQDPAHRPAGVAAGGRIRSRPRTRSSGARGRAARSTPTACATRGASPSTAPTATSSSATSGRTRSRRSTSSRRAARAATNFGWRPWEGRRRNFDEPAPGAVFPVITHSHQAGFCSITGGYVVRDRGVPGAVRPLRLRRLLQLAPARLHPAHRARVDAARCRCPRSPGVSSFGEDAAGRVYVTSLNGPVYRFAAR